MNSQSILSIILVALFRSLKKNQNIQDLLLLNGFNPERELVGSLIRIIKNNSYCSVIELPKFRDRITLLPDGNAFVSKLLANNSLPVDVKISNVLKLIAKGERDLLNLLISEGYAINRSQAIKISKKIEELELVKLDFDRDGIFIIDVVEEEEDVLLIMKGGGIKGIAYVGALEELDKYFNFNWYAGTSAGAISAILLGCGYSTSELKDILLKKNFSDFKDAGFFKKIWNLITKRGLYEANTFTKWMDNMLSSKLDRGVDIKLNELPKRITVFASRVYDGTIIFDSKGTKTSHLRAAYAARCSMSIPFIFTPQKIEDINGYDGGMQNNYPAEIIVGDDKSIAFIGLYLGPEIFEGFSKQSIFKDIINIWSESIDYNALRKYHENTIIIDPRPISTADFNLNNIEKEFLLEAGRLSAIKFLVRENIISELPKDFENRKANHNLIRKQIKRKKQNSKIWKGALFLTFILVSFVFFNKCDTTKYKLLNWNESNEFIEESDVSISNTYIFIDGENNQTREGKIDIVFENDTVFSKEKVTYLFGDIEEPRGCVDSTLAIEFLFLNNGNDDLLLNSITPIFTYFSSGGDDVLKPINVIPLQNTFTVDLESDKRQQLHPPFLLKKESYSRYKFDLVGGNFFNSILVLKFNFLIGDMIIESKDFVFDCGSLEDVYLY
ncbi:hypothetical protein CEQ90_19820 [Lewinellaceae bacterium SD302]|nr:hypothetical protein CEQ90_19820 [Lewinellaceae bacterium SD302]